MCRALDQTFMCVACHSLAAAPFCMPLLQLMRNEFDGLTFDCSPPGACPTPDYNGETALQQFSIADKGPITQNLGILFGLLWGYLFVAYIALLMSVRRAVGGK